MNLLYVFAFKSVFFLPKCATKGMFSWALGRSKRKGGRGRNSTGGPG